MPKKITAITALLLAGSLMNSAHASPPTATHKPTHHSTTAHTGKAIRTGKKKSHSRRLRGQQEIEPERVSQIQSALIKAHYLDGEPNGEWDATTIAAMQKFQADNNWQTKLMPDSRALIKLGLGPDYSSAINAKGANFASMVVQPQPDTTAQPSGFAEASGVKQ